MRPIRPHLAYGGTTCPGDRWREWVPQLQEDGMSLQELEAELEKLRQDATLGDAKIRANLVKLRADATNADSDIRARLDALEGQTPTAGLKRGDTVELR